MPTYQYECEACHHAFEIYQSMKDAKLKKCPECKKEKLVRLVGTGGGIIFKGTGFYETDYKNKPASSSSGSSCGSGCGCHPSPASKPASTEKPA
jgi:putative FmdB family regulatory protein